MPGDVDPDLQRVTRDIMKAILKRRALPTGYAVFFVVAKQTGDEDPRITVASVPPQDTELVAFVLRDAANGLVGASSVESVSVERKPRVPTGNA